MDKKHEIVQAIKDLASELGYTPSRNEFHAASQFSRHDILKEFGGYFAAIAAAGLSAGRKQKERQKKLVAAELFYAPIPIKIDDKIITSPHDWPWFFAYGDLHEPWGHAAKIARAHELLAKHYVSWLRAGKPKTFYVIQIGDALDMLSQSKFARSLNMYNPFEEYKIGRQNLEKFWNEIQKVAPLAKYVQLLGNHDIRPMKRLLEAAPELEPFVRFDDAFRFDGVETIFDPRQPYRMGNILAQHGYLGGLGDHRDQLNANFLCGHTHRGGTVFKNKYDQATGQEYTIAEINAGYLGDPASKALGYTPTKITHWTHGIAQGDGDGPRFIPI